MLQRAITRLREVFDRTADASRNALYSQEQLRVALERQRARADRTGDVFCLLTLGWSDPAGRRRGADALIRIMRGRLRATDEVGWLEADRIGVILHEAPPDAACRVADDLVAAYPLSLPPVISEVYAYPSDRSSSRSHRPSQRQQMMRLLPAGAKAVVPTSPLTGLAEVDLDRWVQRMEPLFVQPLPFWKRLFDIVGGFVGLVLAFPLLILGAFAIKLDSRGPVLFAQQRTGLGGVPFTMYKLRTMHLDADAQKNDLLRYSERDGPFKMANDPRVTPLGRFLRHSSLDELPQLWNVLKGDMSLVGPRPLPPAESQSCNAWQRQRLNVTPGLTCIWQVSGRSEIPFVQWVRMDLQYIRSRSLKQDLKLLLQTIPAVVLRKGAY